MKGSKKLINIRLRDGNVQRVPRERADKLIESNHAVGFLSNTLYKAAKAGVKVQSGQSDTEIKKAIREALKPEPKPKPKKEETSDEDVQDNSKKRRRRGSRSR
jgi:hypothetical protein